MNRVDEATGEIVTISRIERQLAEATTPAEVRREVLQIDLLLKVAKAIGEATERINELQRPRIKAIRQAGAMLAELKHSKGGRPENNLLPEVTSLSPYKQAYTEAQITRKTAAFWQKVAAIPDAIWNFYFDECVATGGEVSLFGLIVYAKHVELQAKAAALGLAAPVLDVQIEVADIRDGLPLDDNSVDVILTDPPYPQEYLPLYEQLAIEAARVLKPGGTLAVMCGQSYLPTIFRLMSQHLTYQWTFAYLTPGGQSAQLWDRKVNTFWKPVLWFVKGEYEGDWKGDVTRSDPNDNDKRFHEWGQSESGMGDLVERFSKPGDLICDPFVGGGTTGIAAVLLKRQFVGFDISAEQVVGARERLTQCVIQMA